MLYPYFLGYCRRCRHSIRVSKTRSLNARSVSSFPGVLCRPCPSHIGIDTLTSSVSVLFYVGSPWIHPDSTPGAMSLLQSSFSCVVPTFGPSGELDISPRCQLSPSLLVSSDSVESILVPGTLLPSICTTRQQSSIVGYTSWVPGTPGPYVIFSLGGMFACNESVVRGLSSARTYDLPGFSPCLLR